MLLPCQTVSTAALTERETGLHLIWFPKYSPHLNRKEREWRYLKRDACSHLARTLREFVDTILAGLEQLGGSRQDIIDGVPQWFLDGHRRAPTDHPPGRPLEAKDSYKRAPRGENLPANT